MANTPHIVFVEASTSGAGELAIQRARQMGYTVTLVTRSRNVYAQSLLVGCNHVIDAETNDAGAVLDPLKQLNATHAISGITTTADLHVPQAAYAAAFFKLPGLRYEAALRVRNKYRMRSRLAEKFPIANPKFALATRLDDLRVSEVPLDGFPLVCKPQNLNDGLDVHLVSSQIGLEDYFSTASRWTVNNCGQPIEHGVLVEEYVEGPEFSVETLQCPGEELQLMGITRKHLTGLPRGRFVEVGHAFPISDADLNLFEFVRECFAALDLDCGVMHTECRIQDGQPIIIEINPRLAGGKIGSHLVELASGYIPVDAVIKIACGEQVRWCPRSESGAAISAIWAEQDGELLSIKKCEEVRGQEGVEDVILYANPGDRVRLPDSNQDIVGVVIARCNDADAAYQCAKKGANAIQLDIQPTTTRALD